VCVSARYRQCSTCVANDWNGGTVGGLERFVRDRTGLKFRGSPVGYYRRYRRACVHTYGCCKLPQCRRSRIQQHGGNDGNRRAPSSLPPIVCTHVFSILYVAHVPHTHTRVLACVPTRDNVFVTHTHTFTSSVVPADTPSR